MKNAFDNILNDCLERLLAKQETMEQCLQSYPEHAAELIPLLQTAMAARKAMAIQPDPAFKARARYQFQAALQQVRPRRTAWAWHQQWVTATAIVLAVLLAGGGTVAAASTSMPDSPLYPVKLAAEQAQMAITTSNIGKTELYARLADRRVAEITYIVDKKDPKRIEAAAERLDENMEKMARLSSSGEAPSTLMAPAPAPALQAPAPVPAPVPPPEKAQSGQSKDEKPQKSSPSNRGKAKVSSTDKANLKTLLEQNAANNAAALRAALEKAPEAA
ncbi:MAG: DUF5667 domain-containing protein, partial [Chloroflexota bacterium]|nr:DUF5667 domain-containing protein [Chloroflexota bacterium]